MYHNTTSMGTQIPKENCKKKKKRQLSEHEKWKWEGETLV